MPEVNVTLPVQTSFVLKFIVPLSITNDAPFSTLTIKLSIIEPDKVDIPLKIIWPFPVTLPINFVPSFELINPLFSTVLNVVLPFAVISESI